MVAMPSFEVFFRQATGHDPFPYQRHLASLTVPPKLLRVPTGSGKTQAVLMAWLWWRHHHGDSGEGRERHPRRLVYVLPMRALVEQTENVARAIMDRLPAEERVPIHTLLGGDADDDWLRYPEREAILIGTQDMLLSRALNRGYAQSRFAWPRAFGLLHNDAYWILDEIQLMGSGLATTTQLEGLRSIFGTTMPVWSTWMSATAEPSWLQTVDHAQPGAAAVLELSEADRADLLADRKTENPLARRLQAVKTLRFSGVTVVGAKSVGAVAECVLAAHQPGSLTLVVLNTVDCARQVYQTLGRKRRRGIWGAPPAAGPEVLLLHSRFRRRDRAEALERLLQAASNPQAAGTIAIATQVVEAGVDVSARTLITELAPWASLVQRLGRLNRTGEFTDSTALWLDLPADDKALAAPYALDQLAISRAQLKALDNGANVSPQALELLGITLPFQPAHVLRRRDLLGLFDTTADLTEIDLDVSAYVRDIDDRDVQVFWRDWQRTGPPTIHMVDEPDDAGDALPDESEAEPIPTVTGAVPHYQPPPASMRRPHRDELCAVPIAEMRKELVKPGMRAFRWDAVDGRWLRVAPNHLHPGVEVLLPASVGRYSADGGWNPELAAPVPPVGQQGNGNPPDTMPSEYGSQQAWQTLVEHTDRVVSAMDRILAHLEIPTRMVGVLRRAARLHDIGKAHPSWQIRLLDKDKGPRPATYRQSLMAKAPIVDWRRGRRNLRHELASALALLADLSPLADLNAQDADLVRYLIASHHGKVRLAIRSLAGEDLSQAEIVHSGTGTLPSADQSELRQRYPNVRQTRGLYALGILDGDELPVVELGDGIRTRPVTLSLQAMLSGDQHGEPSWIFRTRQLRDAPDMGPFRLAYYEALLRAADGRADELSPTVQQGHNDE